MWVVCFHIIYDWGTDSIRDYQFKTEQEAKDFHKFCKLFIKKFSKMFKDETGPYFQVDVIREQDFHKVEDAIHLLELSSGIDEERIYDWKLENN